jgi:hypothetical protein
VSIFVRFFALTDDSPTGDLAFAYTYALEAGRVPFRLVTTLAMYAQDDEVGAHVNRWGRFRDHLLTRVPSNYLNVVCSESCDWAKFWTAGVKNLLVLDVDPLESIIDDARKYDAIAVPSLARVHQWDTVGKQQGRGFNIMCLQAKEFLDHYEAREVL